eukprot:Pgem_evm1s20003
MFNNVNVIAPLLCFLSSYASISNAVPLQQNQPQPNVGGVSGGQNWIGANTYFLWGCSKQFQHNHLATLQSQGIKVVRLFMVDTMTSQYTFPVGCGGQWGAPEYEPNIIGKYNKTVITK